MPRKPPAEPIDHHYNIPRLNRSFFWTAGILTFVFYGLLPCALLLWLIGTPQRRRNKLRVMAEQQLDQPDRPDTQSD